MDNSDVSFPPTHTHPSYIHIYTNNSEVQDTPILKLSRNIIILTLTFFLAVPSRKVCDQDFFNTHPHSVIKDMEISVTQQKILEM